MFIALTYLQDRQTATGAGKVLSAVNAARDVTLTFTSEGTTSGGTILVEESDLATYTGTWSLMETVSAASFTGGAKLAKHYRLGAGLYMRARISATITGGGTVTVTATGA